MQAIPIVDKPMLELLGEKSYICVGDLHIGLEHEMKVGGVHVPSQTHRMESELLALAKGRDGLIILGDVKHMVPGSSRQEYREVPRFFRNLLDVYGSVSVVRGNHDTNLEEMLPDGVVVHPASGMCLEDIGLVHGHTWPSEEVMAQRLLIVAHNHPAIMFEDGLNTNTTERCWVRAPFRQFRTDRYPRLPEEVIMVPSMNMSLKGSPVNFEEPRMLGPLFSGDLIDMDAAKVYLLDGVYLGTVGNLRVKRRRRFKIREPELRGKWE
ncbi:MAG: Calcineurin-like phosphoesterase [Methanomassiliicoccales archaeon PtaU1.Bin124]|nr:MAG: Calcineurin-like phosphoesterase [Methanomassiliicoccales archaeon PtaU1.Bin124]